MFVNVKMFFVLICFINFKISIWSKRENFKNKLIVNVNFFVDMGIVVNFILGNRSIRFFFFWFFVIILFSFFIGRLFVV